MLLPIVLIFGLTEFNNKLYFSAKDGENGSELWVSDGTTEGTQLVKDINPDGGYYSNSYPRDLTEIDNKLYFHG
ncbi:ELWxxDGT repeat protein [Pleurocapsa sp. FMAR1]|uniref:ELWxxDGT repeat protein n=1 Tax=Pleurocapsa sp. FMAR1 TaxID=3040204 RepID=UPI0029C6E264|nr:ELWxxDGT repeat protein [Pleurocapsa sp. FMAR1]